MADATAPVPATINYDDFVKIDLRVATVVECTPHPNADKLLVLQIDLGTERRQICAGLRQHYQPEQLVGKQIIVVANLAPRTMRGEVSNGMLLAATDKGDGRVIVVTPDENFDSVGGATTTVRPSDNVAPNSKVS
jgi:methionine--tRNA ligase beta chain